VKLRQILKRSLGVCFDFDGSKFVSSGDLLLVKYFIHKLSRGDFCEGVKGAFFKIMGFAGKSFLFSPSLPLPAPSISVALAPIFAPPKSKKCLKREEKPKETLATQAMNALDLKDLFHVEMSQLCFSMSSSYAYLFQLQ